MPKRAKTHGKKREHGRRSCDFCRIRCCFGTKRPFGRNGFAEWGGSEREGRCESMYSLGRRAMSPAWMLTEEYHRDTTARADD